MAPHTKRDSNKIKVMSFEEPRRRPPGVTIPLMEFLIDNNRGTPVLRVGGSGQPGPPSVGGVPKL